MQPLCYTGSALGGTLKNPDGFFGVGAATGGARSFSSHEKGWEGEVLVNGKQIDLGVFVIGAVTLTLTVFVGLASSWKEAVFILIVAMFVFWLCVRFGWIVTIGDLMITMQNFPLFPILLVANTIGLVMLISFSKSLLWSVGLSILALGGLYGIYRTTVNPPTGMADRWVGLAVLLFEAGCTFVALWVLTNDVAFRTLGAFAMVGALVIYLIVEQKQT